MAVEISCNCGAFQAKLAGISPKTANHLICYCTDCQAFARHLNQAEHYLDASGGTAIFQTLPANITVTKGVEHIAALRLSPKGLIRWHTNCCNTPIVNTLGSAKFSFAGVMARNVTKGAEQLGPVSFHSNIEDALPPAPQPLGNRRVLVARILWRAFKSRLSGAWRKTPFFDATTNSPVIVPVVLNKQERTEASTR